MAALSSVGSASYSTLRAEIRFKSEELRDKNWREDDAN